MILRLQVHLSTSWLNLTTPVLKQTVIVLLIPTHDLDLRERSRFGQPVIDLNQTAMCHGNRSLAT